MTEFEKMNLLGYLDFIEKNPDQALVTCVLKNPEVVKKFLDWLRYPEIRWTDAAEIVEHPIYQMPESLVLLSRAVTSKDEPYSVALANVTCYPIVSVGWDDFIQRLTFDKEYLSVIREWFNKEASSISTQALTPYGYPDSIYNPYIISNAHYYCWTNSPVADCRDPFDDYLARIVARRRSKLKRAMYKWDHLEQRKQVLTKREMLDWAIPNLRKRWLYDEWPHALKQLLFGHAAAASGSAYGEMFTARLEGKLVACWYYIRQGRTMIYQGMVKDESINTDYLGQASLGYAVQHYCSDKTVNFVDPTCITDPFNGGNSVDNYKRVVVDAKSSKPVFFAAFNEADIKDVNPPYFNGVTGKLESNKATGEITWSKDLFK